MADKFHLRRMGQQSTLPNVPDVMDFNKEVSHIGRNSQDVDFLLNSAVLERRVYISRIHATLIKNADNRYLVRDESLNGIFVNHKKIKDEQILQEGDIVTFGHPKGANIPVGVLIRQPNSEFQFVFERCNCTHSEEKCVEKPSTSTTGVMNVSSQPPGNEHFHSSSAEIEEKTTCLEGPLSKFKETPQQTPTNPDVGKTSSRHSAQLNSDVTLTNTDVGKTSSRHSAQVNSDVTLTEHSKTVFTEKGTSVYSDITNLQMADQAIVDCDVDVAKMFGTTGSNQEMITLSFQSDWSIQSASIEIDIAESAEMSNEHTIPHTDERCMIIINNNNNENTVRNDDVLNVDRWANISEDKNVSVIRSSLPTTHSLSTHNGHTKTVHPEAMNDGCLSSNTDDEVNARLDGSDKVSPVPEDNTENSTLLAEGLRCGSDEAVSVSVATGYDGSDKPSPVPEDNTENSTLLAEGLRCGSDEAVSISVATGVDGSDKASPVPEDNTENSTLLAEGLRCGSDEAVSISVATGYDGSDKPSPVPEDNTENSTLLAEGSRCSSDEAVSVSVATGYDGSDKPSPVPEDNTENSTLLAEGSRCSSDEAVSVSVATGYDGSDKPSPVPEDNTENSTLLAEGLRCGSDEAVSISVATGVDGSDKPSPVPEDNTENSTLLAEGLRCGSDEDVSISDGSDKASPVPEDNTENSTLLAEGLRCGPDEDVSISDGSDKASPVPEDNTENRTLLAEGLRCGSDEAVSVSVATKCPVHVVMWYNRPAGTAAETDTQGASRNQSVHNLGSRNTNSSGKMKEEVAVEGASSHVKTMVDADDVVIIDSDSDQECNVESLITVKQQRLETNGVKNKSKSGIIRSVPLTQSHKGNGKSVLSEDKEEKQWTRTEYVDKAGSWAKNNTGVNKCTKNGLSKTGTKRSKKSTSKNSSKQCPDSKLDRTSSASRRKKKKLDDKNPSALKAKKSKRFQLSERQLNHKTNSPDISHSRECEKTTSSLPLQMDTGNGRYRFTSQDFQDDSSDSTSEQLELAIFMGLSQMSVSKKRKHKVNGADENAKTDILAQPKSSRSETNVGSKGLMMTAVDKEVGRPETDKAKSMADKATVTVVQRTGRTNRQAKTGAQIKKKTKTTLPRSFSKTLPKIISPLRLGLSGKRKTLKTSPDDSNIHTKGDIVISFRNQKRSVNENAHNQTNNQNCPGEVNKGDSPGSLCTKGACHALLHKQHLSHQVDSANDLAEIKCSSVGVSRAGVTCNSSYSETSDSSSVNLYSFESDFSVHTLSSGCDSDVWIRDVNNTSSFQPRLIKHFDTPDTTCKVSNGNSDILSSSHKPSELFTKIHPFDDDDDDDDDDLPCPSGLQSNWLNCSNSTDSNSSSKSISILTSDRAPTVLQPCPTNAMAAWTSVVQSSSSKAMTEPPSVTTVTSLLDPPSLSTDDSCSPMADLSENSSDQDSHFHISKIITSLETSSSSAVSEWDPLKESASGTPQHISTTPPCAEDMESDSDLPSLEFADDYPQPRGSPVSRRADGTEDAHDVSSNKEKISAKKHISIDSDQDITFTDHGDEVGNFDGDDNAAYAIRPRASDDKLEGSRLSKTSDGGRDAHRNEETSGGGLPGRPDKDEMDVVPCAEAGDLPLLSGKRKLLGASSTPSKRVCRPSSDSGSCKNKTEEEGGAGVAGNEDDIENIETCVTRCESVVMGLEKMLNEHAEVHHLPRVKAWLDELQKLKCEMNLPQTVIAVVGDTGIGKSSLLNALLDESSLLPTSGMRACTAVVVEVSHNRRSANYEADITFLSEKEWDDELQLLIKDMTGDDGYNDDLDAANRKVRAVYGDVKAVHGDVKSLEKLKEQRTITQWLGKVLTVTKSNAVDLRQEIDRYIESNDMEEDEDSGEFWPIVKKVHIRVPSCHLCEAGVVLVDLPGLRDANLARSKVAKEYMKNCNIIWVVADIHRAVDNKTAKDLLGESFRRQLYMDGQYGNVAFICTKTDTSIMPAEVMRLVKTLKDECKELQQDLSQLEVELKTLRRSQDPPSEKIFVLEKELGEKRKAFKAVCARARNKLVDQKIRRDFRKGIMEMKQKANYLEQNEEKDIDKTTSLAENLDVFCVSATEYMKLKQLVAIGDGPAQVFSSVDDTGIPRIQQLIHAKATATRKAALKKIIEKVGNFVLDLHYYLNGLGLESTKILSVVESNMQEVEGQTTKIVQSLSQDILDMFNSVILPKLNMGVSDGIDQAEQISKRWGPKNPGGLSYATYKATVQRMGVFNSIAAGPVNFNEDLSNPLWHHITVCWIEVFISRFGEVFDKLKTSLMKIVEEFCTNTSNLSSLDISASHIVSISDQVRRKINTWLTGALSLMDKYVTSEQREITRLVLENIQNDMLATYIKCEMQIGPGSFRRMAADMVDGLQQTKHTMYKNVCYSVMKRLYSMQETLVKWLERLLLKMHSYLKASFEPLWQVSPQLNDLKTTFFKCINSSIEQMESLYEKAGIPFPGMDKEPSAMSVAQPSTSAGQTGVSRDGAVCPQHPQIKKEPSAMSEAQPSTSAGQTGVSRDGAVCPQHPQIKKEPSAMSEAQPSTSAGQTGVSRDAVVCPQHPQIKTEPFQVNPRESRPITLPTTLPCDGTTIIKQEKID